MSWEEIIPEFKKVLMLQHFPYRTFFTQGHLYQSLTAILKRHGYDYTYVGEVVDENVSPEYDHIFCPYKPLNIYEKITDNREAWRMSNGWHGGSIVEMLQGIGDQLDTIPGVDFSAIDRMTFKY